MTKKIRNEAFESIHSSAKALLKVGAIDEACMGEVSAELSDQEDSPELRASPQTP